MRKDKGFTGIEVIIAICIVAVLAGGWVAWRQTLAPSQVTPTPIIETLTPTPAPQTSEGWKHYESTNLKLSFDYPKDFAVSETDGIVTLRNDAGYYWIEIGTLPDPSLTDVLSDDTYRDGTIDGKRYTSRQYVHSEEGMSEDGTQFVNTLTTELIPVETRENFTIAITQKNIDEQDPSSDVSSFIGPSETDIANGDLIIKSIIFQH